MSRSSQNKDSCEPISILIVDDHEIIRQAIKLVLQKEDDMRVVFEARDGEEAVAAYEHAKPDITLMDVRMPTMNGIEATNLITNKYEGSKIIMLTSDDTTDTVVAALASGAKGYCLKNVSAQHLADGVRLVYGGDIWLCSGSLKVYAKELKKIHSPKAKSHLNDTIEERIPNTAAPKAFISYSQKLSRKAKY